VFYSVEARVKDEATLGPLVDAIRPLKLNGTIEGTLTIRSPLHIVSKLARRKDLWSGEGAVPDEVIDKEIIPRFNVAWWNVNFGLYGPREIVEARLLLCRRVLEALPGTEVIVRRHDGVDVREETIDPSDLHRAGIPNLTPFAAVKWRGENGGTIAFAPITPMSGEHAVRQVEIVRRYGREYGFDYYGSFNAGSRSMNHVFQIFFDRDSEKDMANLREMFPKLIAECAAAGYSEYRAHLGFMDAVQDMFTFNDNALGRVTAKLKDALDPNGVLNPGKQGIWPKTMRQTARPSLRTE
jgi:4-cresol dehydrogenase (hydroxylating)